MKKIYLLLIIILVSVQICIIYNANRAITPLQIVFTNDSHSSIEPLKGIGGYEARARVVDSLRKENPNTIMLDAGDMFQGSPYFNLYFGRVEIEGYNIIGYDAVTLGNHEFDHGMDTLAARIREMNFPVVCCNYDTDSSAIAGLLKPYTIIESGEWKVGVIGACINPENLVMQGNYAGVKYREPIDSVNKYADILKNQESCDVVLVLSHLGYQGEGYEINTDDHKLLSNTRNVDLIMGGHTHGVDSVFYLPNVDGVTTTTLQSSSKGKDVYVIEFSK